MVSMLKAFGLRALGFRALRLRIESLEFRV